MTVSELVKTCGFEIIHMGNGNLEISKPYCRDLLSIAMGNAPAGCAWCTVMSNMNTLAVASLADASCIILCEGTNVDDNMKMKAVTQNINLFRAPLPIFECALKVHQLIHG